MARDIRRDEFEGRNRQLPADLDQTQQFTVAADSRRDMESTPLGTPPDCYDVRSVYDSRPVNGTDFNIIASAEFGGEGLVTTNLIEMSVPEGYVAVLRRTKIWLEPVYGQNRSDVSASLTLNSGDVAYNVDLLVGGDADDIDTFIIGNEFNQLGVRVTLNAGVLVDDDFIGYVWFYGNLLLKTDRPPPFEIANRTLTGQCAPAPVVTIKPAPLPAPIVAPVPVRVPAKETKGPPFNILVGTIVGSGHARKRVLMVEGGSIGRRRAATAAEIAQYKPFFDAVKATEPPHTIWINS